MARARARSSSSAALSLEFGRRVRARREEIDPPISQERLAELAGVHRTYISYIELGKGAPTLDTIVRIAAALSIDPGQLVREMLPASSGTDFRGSSP